MPEAKSAPAQEAVSVFVLVEALATAKNEVTSLQEQLEAAEGKVEEAEAALKAHADWQKVEALLVSQGKRAGTGQGRKPVEGWPILLIDPTTGEVRKDFEGNPVRRKSMLGAKSSIPKSMLMLVTSDVAKSSAWYNHVLGVIEADYRQDGATALDIGQYKLPTKEQVEAATANGD